MNFLSGIVNMIRPKARHAKSCCCFHIKHKIL